MLTDWENDLYYLQLNEKNIPEDTIMRPHTYRLNGRFCTYTTWLANRITVLRAHVAKLIASLRRNLSRATRTAVINAICELITMIKSLTLS